MLFAILSGSLYARQADASCFTRAFQKDAIVRSWLPHEGRVEITPSYEGSVRVRMPSGVDERTLELKIDGSLANPSFLKSNYAEITNVSAGSTVVCRFPLSETKTREVVLGVEYTTEWVSDTVVGISPAGSRVPLYRQNKKTQKTLSTVEKSIPDITFKL